MPLKKHIYKLLLTLIIIIQATLLIYHMDKKADLYVDEIYTFTLANSNNGMYFPPTIFKSSPVSDLTNKWIDSKIFKDYLSVTQDNKYNYSKVYDNQLDDTHPPLYYCLIHTICSFFSNTFSKWYGFSLNLVLFIITQLLLFKVSKTILNSNKYALFTCIIYGFSCASTDNYTYISTNALLTPLYLLSLNYFIRNLDKRITIPKFIELFTIILIGGLTHYLFILYITLLALTFIVLSIKNNNSKKAYSILCTTLFTFLWIYLLFPDIKNQILYSIYVQEIILGVDNQIANIGAFSYLIRKILGIPFPYYFYIGALCFIVLSTIVLIKIIKQYFDKQNLMFLTIIPTFIATMIISFCINYNETEINPIKYFLPFLPIVAIFGTSFLKKINYKYVTVIFIIIATLSPLWRTSLFLKETSNNYSSIKNLLAGNNVIVYLPDKNNLQALVTTFSLCNKIYLSSYTNQKLNEIPVAPFKQKEKTYLLTDNTVKLDDVSYKKLKTCKISNYEVNVYEL